MSLLRRHRAPASVVPANEGQQALATAAGEALHRMRLERHNTLDAAIRQIDEQLHAFEVGEPAARPVPPSDGPFQWAGLYCSNPQTVGTHPDAYLRTARTRISAVRWRSLEKGKGALFPVDVRDAIALAIGNPLSGDVVAYRGAIDFEGSNIYAHPDALKMLVLEPRRRENLHANGIAGSLMIGDGGAPVTEGGRRYVRYETLTGLPETDAVFLEALAPFISPSSSLECRLREDHWHWRFENGKAVRVEGRDPHLVMYERLAEVVGNGLNIADPKRFEQSLSAAFKSAAVHHLGVGADGAALAQCRDSLIAFLSQEPGDGNAGNERAAILQALRDCAGTYLGAGGRTPAHVLIAAVNRGVFSHINPPGRGLIAG